MLDISLNELTDLLSNLSKTDCSFNITKETFCKFSGYDRNSINTTDLDKINLCYNIKIYRDEGESWKLAYKSGENKDKSILIFTVKVIQEDRQYMFETINYIANKQAVKEANICDIRKCRAQFCQLQNLKVHKQTCRKNQITKIKAKQVVFGLRIRPIDELIELKYLPAEAANYQQKHIA